MKNGKKKKIAVLTWKLRNYGTALQSYALCRWINEYGAACRLIDYSLPSSDKIVRVNRLTPYTLLKKLYHRIKNIILTRRNSIIAEKYRNAAITANKRFLEFYALTPSEPSLPTMNNAKYYEREYDLVIVGSDQVWSPKYFNETYFLNFVSNIKKVAYAPSLGVSRLTHSELQFIKERIGSFQYLSVRESTSAELLGLSDENVMCDPVLLFNGSQWCKMLDLKNQNYDDYILVYTLSTNNWYKKFINKIADECQYKIIAVVPIDMVYFYNDEPNITIKIDVGPIEWLELILNAKIVVTDSFHGICFAILFEKQFLALKRFSDSDKGNENSRVSDLLVRIGLENHLIGEKMISWKEYSSEIKNYKKSIEKSNIQLNSFRNRSIDYLTRIINS